MKISVITPVYMGNRYLNTLLAMVNANAKKITDMYFDIQVEYVLVNDSPQIPLQYDKGLIESFDIKIINNTQNSGIHASRVNGLNVCTGEYVCFLDQDDSIVDYTLLSQYHKIGDYDMVISNGYICDNGVNSKIFKNGMCHWLAAQEFFYIYFSTLIISPGQCLIKKSSIPDEWKKHILKQNGSDDYFLWILLFDRGAKIAINKDYLFIHNKTGSNLSMDRKKLYASSKAFCDVLFNNRLIENSKSKAIIRRTSFKQSWKYGDLNGVKKAGMIIQNSDILLFNSIYRLLRLL